MPKRRRYSEEYKQEAVLLVESSDKSLSQVSWDLGINNNMLGRWCREFADSPKQTFRGQGMSRDEEMTALRQAIDEGWRTKGRRCLC
jgi:transposase